MFSYLKYLYFRYISNDIIVNDNKYILSDSGILYIMKETLYVFKNVVLNNHIKGICITDSTLYKFDNHIPDNLQFLQISNCRLRELKCNLHNNIRTIILWGNKLTSFKYVLPNSLLGLYLNDNNIKKLKLNFIPKMFNCDIIKNKKTFDKKAFYF